MKRLNQFLHYANELFDSETKEADFDYLWRILEVLLAKEWREIQWSLEQIEQFIQALEKVLKLVSPKSYALRLPVVKKILWFCDDILSSKTLSRPSEKVVSEFHDFVLEFRADHSSLFTKHKRNILLDFEPEIIKEMDKHFTTDSTDQAMEQAWVLADEKELSPLISKYLSSCNEENDFE
ncbi:hypothetical protein MJH12_05225, partial [bacterium]|nr:hypothetical protein [bacterium]